MINLETWIHEQNRIARVAELFAVNGFSTEVKSVGNVGPPQPGNRYGRSGLTINEAFELTYYKGVIDALINAHGNPQFNAQFFQKELKREVEGNLIEIPTPEQQKAILKC